MCEIVKLICGCGASIALELGEDMNYKDVAICKCGREFLVVELLRDED